MVPVVLRVCIIMELLVYNIYPYATFLGTCDSESSEPIFTKVVTNGLTFLIDCYFDKSDILGKVVSYFY